MRQEGPLLETLVIHLGSVHALDEPLSTAMRNRRIVFAGKHCPSADRQPGPDVLLAASAEGAPGDGSTYLIVGVLRGIVLAPDRSSVEFTSIERFVVPLVVGHSSGPVRQDLLRARKYWSPQEFYWLPLGSAERCVAEAHRLLDPSLIERV
jgi:hypothetical protein